ncbi:hypothetical protein FLX27_26135, partial [Agrobacterium tumefaciens]
HRPYFSRVGVSGQAGAVHFGRDGESCIQQIATPRPRRADPYYFDIPNDNGVKERFWFNLNH